MPFPLALAAWLPKERATAVCGVGHALTFSDHSGFNQPRWGEI